MADRYFKIGEKIASYEVESYLGEGRYGIVYLVKDHTGQSCILKQLKQEMLRQTLEKVAYEQKILETLDDTRFPRFIEKIEKDTLYAYVLQYIKGEVVEDLLRKKHYIFDRTLIYHLTEQIVDILELLHSKDILHRDIRPPNVILNADQKLHLIDFGLARYRDEEKYVQQMDYWYLGDFLIHLYYTMYTPNEDAEEKPWYEELALQDDERYFLKRLMGIEEPYPHLGPLREDFNKMKQNK